MIRFFEKYPYREMARIGTTGELDIRIYPEKLGNPSFHIVHNDWQIIVEIKTFKILEVKKNHKTQNFKKGELINRKLYKELVKLFNKKTDSRITNWIYLIETWNKNNPQYKININSKIPEL